MEKKIKNMDPDLVRGILKYKSSKGLELGHVFDWWHSYDTGDSKNFQHIIEDFGKGEFYYDGEAVINGIFDLDVWEKPKSEFLYPDVLNDLIRSDKEELPDNLLGMAAIDELNRIADLLYDVYDTEIVVLDLIGILNLRLHNIAKECWISPAGFYKAQTIKRIIENLYRMEN